MYFTKSVPEPVAVAKMLTGSAQFKKSIKHEAS